MANATRNVWWLELPKTHNRLSELLSMAYMV
jgi:hypothetical protein